MGGTHWPSGSHSSPRGQLQPATQLSSSPQSSGSPQLRPHAGAHSWYSWPPGHRTAGHRDTCRSGAALPPCLQKKAKPAICRGQRSFWDPPLLQSPWIPLCWKECKGAASWLSRLTAEGPVSPGRQGTLLGTAPSIGRKHGTQAASTGHRQSRPGAQPHTAAKQRRWNGSLSTSPWHSLEGDKEMAQLRPMDSPLPPPGAQHGSE